MKKTAEKDARNKLQFLRNISWDEIFRIWEKQERHQKDWQHLLRLQGFSSWKAWRRHILAPITPKKRRWMLYEIVSPGATIPSWHGGPFRFWQKYRYDGKRTVSFNELAQTSAIKNYKKIRLFHFRTRTASLMIGAQWKDRVYVLDGMHRACAIALAVHKKLPIRGRFMIAITTLRKSLPQLD